MLSINIGLILYSWKFVFQTIFDSGKFRKLFLDKKKQKSACRIIIFVKPYGHTALLFATFKTKLLNGTVLHEALSNEFMA